MSINMENKNNRKAIQILRGSNDKIVGSTDKLLDGQLLYNKDKNYITVGNNKSNFNSQPIRVRELGGFSSDDSSIGKEDTGEFYIRHDGASLNIYDNSFLEIKCPQIRMAAREESGPNSIEISATTVALNSNTRTRIATGGSLELSFYDSLSIKDKYKNEWFTATPPATSDDIGKVQLKYDLISTKTIHVPTLWMEDTNRITAHVHAAAATIVLTNPDESNKTTINNGSITTTGQIEANSFNARSDARLKTNIKPLTYHDSILDIPVCEYDWKDSGKHAIGFIAQDLKEVYPELVDENEDGILSIKETKLVYLLVEEVKKLKEEIQELKK